MSDIKYNRIDEDLQQKTISDREAIGSTHMLLKTKWQSDETMTLIKPIYGVPCLFVM